MKRILGLSFNYHDSAACLLRDGKVVAAAQEERFTRVKHDASFPRNAIEYCLKQDGCSIDQVDAIAFYEKPFVKFERILHNLFGTWPWSLGSFPLIINSWLGKKIKVAEVISKELNYDGEILFGRHHLSHAASAYYNSGFDHAAVLTLDGVGEWSTATIAEGKGAQIRTLSEVVYPHSLGLLYSAFTAYLGFKVNDGEYKVMGLAPYGKPRFEEAIMREMIDLREDGSFTLDMKYLQYQFGRRSFNERRFRKLFGFGSRTKEQAISQDHKDLAASIQKVVETVVIKMAKQALRQTGAQRLCLAGGVALNCVANRRLQEELDVPVFVFPAPGDAGGAVGVAQWVWHHLLEHPLHGEKLQQVYWGPEFSDTEVEAFLKRAGVHYRRLGALDLIDEISGQIKDQKVVGWFQGRMEFGPRALGARSILADARNLENWKRVNLKIKFRESFRPFAPSVLEESCAEYFTREESSPFMLFTTGVKVDNLPAITHVDQSARIQTVSAGQNTLYHQLISAFKQKTGVGAIINTSFNLADEPIVCTPQDAYRTFLRCEMDTLVLGSFVLEKTSPS